jgi:hypothetical protein
MSLCAWVCLWGGAPHTARLSRLTQLSSLRIFADGVDIAHLSALEGLSSLSLDDFGVPESSIEALAGLLEGLDALTCGVLGSEAMDPSLLHSIGCTSLHVARLYANCQLVSPDKPPLPRLQSLQLEADPSASPLVLHLTGLISLSIGRVSSLGVSDDDCRQLADRLPLLRALKLDDGYSRNPPACLELTLDGLQQLTRLQHLQQLCLVHRHLPLLAYPVLAQCRALRRLLLDCSERSQLSGAGLEACLASLAAARQLRHVVLLREVTIGATSSACEALQEVCDRVVGAWRRHELVMEVKRWESEQAWAHMLEQAAA